MYNYDKKLKGRLLPSRSIFVDVDNTLISPTGRLNRRMVIYCELKKNQGFDIILWSARGRVYAERVAKKFNIVDLFYTIIGKPKYIFDDIGWEWTRDTRILKYDDIKDF